MIRTKVIIKTSLAIVLACAGAFLTRPALAASINNGGFESGSLSAWTSTGDASVVTSSFGSAPASGTYQALIQGGANGSDPGSLETFLSVPGGSLDALGNGTVHGGSAIAQTFTATGGETLSFNWNFITDEVPPSVFNDFAFWSLNSSLSTLASANGSTLTLNPSGLLQTGAAELSVVIPTSGTYTLDFGVANVSDTGGTPQLLVDNVQLGVSTPEPAYGPGIAVVMAGVMAAITLRKKFTQTRSRVPR
jgi:hypothetical protein